MTGPTRVTYAYDARGRVVRRTLAVPGVTQRTWTYEWTAAGQIASARCPDGRVLRFTYDALGRRVKKVASDGAQTTWVWDQNSLACEVRRDAAGTEAVRTFVWEERDEFRPSAHHEGSTWYDVVTTPLGTPTELVDETGAIAWSLQLRAFGVVEQESRLRASSPVRFPGQLADDDLGLHYNRFRDYDPEAGRYLTPDPTGLEGGLNAYAYARNPIGWKDPFGQADGAALAAEMADERPDGYQTHHIIPEKLYNDPEMNEILGDTGGPHDGKNGIHLPSSQEAFENNGENGPKTIHKGGHAGYTKAVKEKLKADHAKAVEENDGEPLPPCKKAALLQGVRDQVRKDLEQGTWEHQDSKNKTVNGLNKHGVAKSKK